MQMVCVHYEDINSIIQNYVLLVAYFFSFPARKKYSGRTSGEFLCFIS
jgi:hypothetical protein